MPAPVTYIPPREADFVNWITNFNTLIQASPSTYGISTSDASTLASLTSTYLAAYAVATTPSTRTPDAVAAKNAARVNVTAFARLLSSQIQLNQGVSQDQKTALGLTDRKALPTPIPAPTTSPLLSFVASTPLQQTLRAADQNTPAKRGKPFGALQLILQVWILPIGTSPSGAPNLTLPYTKQPMAVNFSSGDVGKNANYIGFWQTRTGLKGPNSAALSAVIV